MIIALDLDGLRLALHNKNAVNWMRSDLSEVLYETPGWSQAVFRPAGLMSPPKVQTLTQSKQVRYGNPQLLLDRGMSPGGQLNGRL